MGEAFQHRWALDRRRAAPVLFRVLFLFLLLHLACHAQTTSKPVLHGRADSEAIEEQDASTISHGTSTLSPDVSGEYVLGTNGETVEIELEPKRLSGYIMRMGDRASDAGTPLTFFFATSSLNGKELSFTTHRIHGVWFSFQGTIVRGAAESRAQEGYYRLEGNLVLHDTANEAEQSRHVSLPLARQYSNH